MSLLSRFFYKRPPDGLLEFVERVYGNIRSFNLNLILSLLSGIVSFDCPKWHT